ncbi:hypothetical protein LTR37_010381 [Vermiconidia calcicola]|uniref:Uncharacterized protein n=1 Tax=Vermiconidia calcicola TaxID=1690605 RepID=A0ACC3N807_9PEZI|nr:hypothetical protein LTR37_010381 [Vermiconidia calcicola]
MGLWDGRSESYSAGYGRSSQPRRTHSPARSTRSTHSSASKGYYARPSNTRSHSSGVFGGSSRGLFDTGSSRSGGGIFGFGSGGGSSYYKRSPRQGYISYLYNKLRRMLKELMYYAKRHPLKAFFAIVVPLLSAGGAVHGLVRQFGIRVPMMDGGSRRGGGGYYGSSGYGGNRDGGGGLMENAGGLFQIAKAFM